MCFARFKSGTFLWRMSPKTFFATNLGQHEVTFQLLNGRFIFRIGMAAASLTVWNPTWDEFDRIQKVMSAGTEAVRAAAKLSFEKCFITLDMHVAPTGRTIGEITRPFISNGLNSFPVDEVSAFGFILHRGESHWHVDASAAFAESLFLRIVRSFSPTTLATDMASAVHSDQSALLGVLGLDIRGVV